jgi:DNA-binding MarR family transcriptional regulator
MTKTPMTDAKAAYRAEAARALADAGFDAAAIDALLAFDAEHFLYVRRVMKGDIPQSLMDELAAGVEVSQFHALASLLRIRSGYGRGAPQEPTVGLLAEEMCLDPSRASRIAADLVDRGLLTRGVSQEDGRRSILIPTEAAMKLMGAFLIAKWQRNIRVFQGWTTDEIETFSRLFARYNDGIHQHYPVRGPAGPATAQGDSAPSA